MGGSPASESRVKEEGVLCFCSALGCWQGEKPTVKFKEMLGEDLKWPRSTLELFSCVFPGDSVSQWSTMSLSAGSLVCLRSSR